MKFLPLMMHVLPMMVHFVPVGLRAYGAGSRQCPATSFVAVNRDALVAPLPKTFPSGWLANTLPFYLRSPEITPGPDRLHFSPTLNL